MPDRVEGWVKAIVVRYRLEIEYLCDPQEIEGGEGGATKVAKVFSLLWSSS